MTELGDDDRAGVDERTRGRWQNWGTMTEQGDDDRARVDERARGP